MSFLRGQFLSSWRLEPSFSNAHGWTHHLRDVPVISIIDDDESIRNGTMRLLRSLGFVAHAFPSAHTFLHSAQLHETSCLISDIHMPGMNGIQLQDILHSRGHKIPIIFITAFPDDKIRTQALVRGAVCFLYKPIDGETLSHCIDTALKDNTGKKG